MVGLAAVAGLFAADAPQFTKDGQLVLPANYREWIFLSSGLGMTYDSGSQRASAPNFTNVFVAPSAYRAFLEKGTWPDNTLLILEIRASASEGSINKGGQYQTDVVTIEAEVKDTRRFPGSGWAFFALGKATTGKVIPSSATCYSCHSANGAVDNTFVQFYPSLIAVAKQKGTMKAANLATPAQSH